MFSLKKKSVYTNRIKKAILAEAILVLVFAAIIVRQTADTRSTSASAGEDYIKWVDFDVTYEALCEAYAWDVDTYESSHHVNWIELLAYTAAKTGGKFDSSALKTLKKAAQELSEGAADIGQLTKDLKYYDYYYEAYNAVLGGLVGEFEEENVDESGNKSYQTAYGLKSYFPLAYGFDYSHYDDFGAGRSYGYQRKHLGHDMMGQIGTPIGIKDRTWILKNNFQVLTV